MSGGPCRRCAEDDVWTSGTDMRLGVRAILLDEGHHDGGMRQEVRAMPGYIEGSVVLIGHCGPC